MRWNQWKRTSLSLVMVLAMYWAYTAFVVPLIEPPLATANQHLATPHPAASRVTERFQAEMAGLFPPDAWENRSPKVLRHRSTLVLFQDYQPQDDGTIRVFPCTVIFRKPTPEPEPPDDPSSSLVLQAPEGAILQLSRPLDAQSIQLGQPVKGHLLGPIRITSPGQADGKGRLQILSSDVSINEQRLWTPNEVDFQYETSRARGRDLMIKLMPTSNEQDPAAPQGWAGIRSIELIHLDELHLEVAEDAPPIIRADGTIEPAPTSPVDVACQGPLRINFLENVMTFEDDVRLRRVDPSGAVDSLNCERLMLYISHSTDIGPDTDTSSPAKAAAPDAADRSRSLPKLELQRVVAEGNPVVLDAASRHAQIRGRKLLYDLKQGRYRVWADEDSPADQVWFQYEQQQITARELDCQFQSPRVLSRVRATGPGVFSGQLNGRTPQPIEARWQELLLLEQDAQLYRLTLSKSADVQLADQHRIQADRLYLWLEPIARAPDAPTNDRWQFRPHKLLALADPAQPERRPVRLRSEATTAETQRLETVFRHAQPPADAPRRAAQDLAPQTNTLASRNLNATGNGQRTHEPAGIRPGSQRLPLINSASRHASHVSSQEMHIVLRVEESGMELADVALLQRVRVSQRGGAESRQSEFELRADRVSMKPTADPSSPILIADGEVVEIESPQMLLQTTQLQLDRASNLVSSERPGRMFLLVDRDASGQRLATPQKMTVQWKQHMDFDGRYVRFGGQVEVKSPDQQVRSELLEIRLNREVRFSGSSSSSGNPLEIEHIHASGNVIVRADQQVDGHLTSQTKLQVPFVNLNRITGELRAGGPGRLVTLREGFRGNLGMPGGPTGPGSGTRPPQLDPRMAGGGRLPPIPRLSDASSGPAPSNEKTYLQVDYNGSIEGNLNERIVHFQEHVEVIYGPVQSWNETLQPRGGLGKNDVLLSCQRLTVAQGAQPIDGRASFDLQAQGNTYIEGQTFTARGERVSFEQAKDLLVLEGSDRADAVLSHQARVGAPRSEQVARKILYWPSSRNVQVDDARYSDLSNLGL